MRILFVASDTNPFGSFTNGDIQRTRLLLKACSLLGEVEVVSFLNNVISDLDGVKVVYSNSLDHMPKPNGRIGKWLSVGPWGGLQSLIPVNRERERVIDDIVRHGHYDLIVTRYLFRACACGLLKYKEKLVLDFDDDPRFFFLSAITPESSFFRKLRLNLAARKVKRITDRTIPSLQAAFFAELRASQLFRGTYLPNIPYYQVSCPDADFNVMPRRLLFVGLLDYAPNRDGIDRFLEKVYMPLRERMPQVEFEIVGYLSQSAVKTRWLQYPGVRLAGFVDDLRVKYEESHVVVVPVYICGGTNIKVLEAMQMNRACVTTKEAYAKMNGCFQKNMDLYVADTDLEFVDALCALLSDEQLNRKVAHNGKSVMEQYFSLDAFYEIVKNAMV